MSHLGYSIRPWSLLGICDPEEVQRVNTWCSKPRSGRNPRQGCARLHRFPPSSLQSQWCEVGTSGGWFHCLLLSGEVELGAA